MARFTGENIEQYGSQGGGSKGTFFSLKNDKDVARVRFLYSSADDIEGFSVHRVQVGDGERSVNCLRELSDPIDVCPFCRERFPVQAKMFVPLYNEDTNQLQTWERGKKFYGQISGLCARYPNIVSQVFDIERNGKPRDTATTYQIFPVGSADGTTVEDILDDLGIDSLPSPLGTIILNKTAEEMEEYISTGEFPSNDNAPVRRRSTSTAEEEPRRRGRDIPTRGRGDRF
jgi:hypothetical protein